MRPFIFGLAMVTCDLYHGNYLASSPPFEPKNFGLPVRLPCVGLWKFWLVGFASLRMPQNFGLSVLLPLDFGRRLSLAKLFDSISGGGFAAVVQNKRDPAAVVQIEKSACKVRISDYD